MQHLKDILNESYWNELHDGVVELLAKIIFTSGFERYYALTQVLKISDGRSFKKSQCVKNADDLRECREHQTLFY